MLVRAAKRHALVLVLAAASQGCLGIESPLGVEEPLVVQQGEFKKGKLPGTKGDGPETAPRVTEITLATGRYHPGAHNVSLSGHVTENAYSVAVRLAEAGSGYWVVPVGAEDVLLPGQRLFDLNFNIGSAVEPGPHELGLVALDKDGRAGRQTYTKLCILSDMPDGGNVCDPKKEPPYAIASLRWNVDADLDLIVIGPDGTRYSRSNFSQVVDGKVVARLDADRTSGCLLDGRHTENFVWHEKPKKGTWYIHANLFDACDQPTVRFELTTYRKKSNKDGTFALVEQKSVGGELLRVQANPDSSRPLYLTKIEFP